VQLVGMLERGAVTGHYCRSNRAIDLFVLMPGSSIELQPEILVGLVSGDEIQGRFYVRKSNDPDEGYSPARGFRLKRVNACPTNWHAPFNRDHCCVTVIACRGTLLW
jgi:hypothetical protein